MACCELAGTSAFFTPGLRLVYAALTEAQLHEAHTGCGRALAGAGAQVLCRLRVLTWVKTLSPSCPRGCGQP